MDARLLAILMQSRLPSSRRFMYQRWSTPPVQHFSAVLDGSMARSDTQKNTGAQVGTNVSPMMPRHNAHLQHAYAQPARLLASSEVGRHTFETPDAFEALIQKTAAQYNVDPALVTAVVRYESSFNPHATSRVGAAGLMQLMPATARELGVTDVYNPVQNVDGGVRYLKRMLERYDGDVKLALAAYNAGPGNVDRYGGVPPFGETQRYITKILSALERA